MIEKYNIIKQHTSFYNHNDFYYYIPTLEGDMNTLIGDYIATGIKGEHYTINEDVFKKSYADLPVLPKKVADEIEHRKTMMGLREYWISFEEIFYDDEDVEIWIDEHEDYVTRAWLDGYTTEDE